MYDMAPFCPPIAGCSLMNYGWGSILPSRGCINRPSSSSSVTHSDHVSFPLRREAFLKMLVRHRPPSNDRQTPLSTPACCIVLTSYGHDTTPNRVLSAVTCQAKEKGKRSRYGVRNTCGIRCSRTSRPYRGFCCSRMTASSTSSGYRPSGRRRCKSTWTLTAARPSLFPTTERKRCVGQLRGPVRAFHWGGSFPPFRYAAPVVFFSRLSCHSSTCVAGRAGRLTVRWSRLVKSCPFVPSPGAGIVTPFPLPRDIASAASRLSSCLFL